LVAEAVIDKINGYLDGSKSPVKGGKFKPFKADKSPSQLHDKGDMRSALDYSTKENSNVMKIGVFDDDQAIKLFNHNTADTLPMRKMIPLEGEIFKQPIINTIKRIINDEI